MLVTEERVRQFHVELINDRGCLQELHHLCGLLVEHLFDEETRNHTLRSGKASDERGCVLGVVLERQRRQLDPGHPPFGPLGQGMHVAAGQVEAEVLHEGADVLLFQPEVRIPDLSELAPGPPTLDRQNGIHAGPDDDMHSLRESLDEGGQSAKGGWSDDVQIIEDEPRGSPDHRANSLTNAATTSSMSSGPSTRRSSASEAAPGSTVANAVAMDVQNRSSSWSHRSHESQAHRASGRSATHDDSSTVLPTPGLPATNVQGNPAASSKRLSRPGRGTRVSGKGGRINFVTAGLAPITQQRLTKPQSSCRNLQSPG